MKTLLFFLLTSTTALADGVIYEAARPSNRYHAKGNVIYEAAHPSNRYRVVEKAKPVPTRKTTTGEVRRKK